MGRKQTEFVWKLFMYRCVMCKQRGTEMNHIIPRSEDRALINDWKNWVPLCHLHHEEYHKGGLTDEKIAAMKKARADFLTAIGKEVYI